MKIEIVNRQKTAEINLAKARKLIEFLLQRAVRILPSLDLGELSVVFTGNKEIKRLNFDHLGKDNITDVISFRLPSIPGEQGRYSGELFINVEIAIEEGSKRRNWGPARELALYIAHGCDHLTGACDYTTKSRNRMRRRELLWLRQAGKKNLLKELLRME